MRRASKPIEIRPPMGGQLMTASSPDAPGPANYRVKMDFRRVDDCEQRSEGYDFFRPNTGIPLGSQPLFDDDDITLVHEVIRPNRDRCIIVGTQTTLYRYFSQTGGGYYATAATYYDNSPTAYFEDNPGQWVVIGDGFSNSGKRWQAVDINGYVVLNNQVDLPVTYRVEEFTVLPIYELRELGVASVGYIAEFDSYLVCGNIKQIQDGDLVPWMSLLTSGDTIGTQTGAVSSSDTNTTGSINLGSTTLTSSKAIFDPSYVGKTVRFLNGFTATIATYYNTTSVALSSGPTETIGGMIFIITRPVQSGMGSVRNTNILEAYWTPGSPAVFASTMAGDFYVLFENGWSSGIASVTDFKTLTLVKTPPMPINGMGFQLFPSEYLMTLSGGTFLFDDTMGGTSAFYGYKQRKLLSVIDTTHAIASSDYPITAPLVLTNPAAYGVYTGPTDGIGYRLLWGLPGEPRRFAASGPCSILAGDTLLRLDYPMKSLAVGDEIIVIGAGISGGNLLSTVKFVGGVQVALADRAITTVGGGPIQAATLTRSGTTATFTSVSPHFLATAQSVTISGATPQEFNGTYAITKTGANTFTYTLGIDPGANATGSISALLDKGLIGQSNSLGSSAGSEDLQDDGSQILNMTKLRDTLVIYRETSIFLCGTSQQNDIPFAFSDGPVYGGTKSGDSHAALAFPNAVATVVRSSKNSYGGEMSEAFHVYPGKNDFYKFDLVTQTPQVFEPLHQCRNLFFNEVDEADRDDVFAADNPITKEVLFCYPSAFEGSGAINPNTGVPPPAPPIIVTTPAPPPPTPPPPPAPLYLNTVQCYTATCGAGYSGTKEVCVGAGTFSSSDPAVGQAGVDAQALAEATAQANAQLVCVPMCHDEATCGTSIGWEWNGSAWQCYTGGAGGIGGVNSCLDLVTNVCIKDFTFISTLFCVIPTKAYPPPNTDGLNCNMLIDYASNNGASNGATCHAEYQYGGGVDPTRLYTITVRVRGVCELKRYDSSIIPPYTGHVDPNQPFVFVVDAINPPVGGGPGVDPISGSGNAAFASGGENEYTFEVVDPDTGNAYIYMLNNWPSPAISNAIQAVDYTFKLQVKKGWEVNLLGTSCDSKEFPNPPLLGLTPIEVHNEPIAIKVTQPYPGQFLQFDVISITY